MKLSFTPKFVKQYRLLYKRDAKLARNLEKRIAIFIKEPYHPILKTHRLAGKLKNKSAFWISWDLRVVFEYIGEDEVRFLALGKHDEVYR